MDHTPSHPSSSRIPSSFRTSRLTAPTASSLGKRASGDAGLGDDPSSARKALSMSTARQSTLERHVLELKRSLQQRDEQLEEQRVKIERLRNERRVLLDGETKEKNQGERREREWAEERQDFINKIGELRRRSTKQAAEIEEKTGQLSAVVAQNTKLRDESKGEINMLSSRLQQVEEESKTLRGWEKRARNLAIELAEEKRKAQEGAERARQSADDRKGEAVVREEIRRQSQHLVSLQQRHDSLQAEVSELRRQKQEADAAAQSAKETERGLREDISSLHEQLDRSRREVDSLTQTPSSRGQPAEDAATLQTRLASLAALHSQTEAQLTAKTKEADNLLSRLETIGRQSQSTSVELVNRVRDLEREVRWAQEGRRTAEVREALARQELENSQASGSSRGADGAGSAARVKQLEELVETYKSQLAALSRDSRDVEDRIARGVGMVKASDLEAAHERIRKYGEDAKELQATIDDLTAANTNLDAEVMELMSRVASGEYNTATERCLELKENPAAKIRAVRTQQLEELKAENAALLIRLAEVDKGVPSQQDGLVPRESFDRLSKEKADGEAAHEKRLMRLKEIFGLKSREFLEAVYSLLGWRIRFDENGADIRLTSMYAPKGKMGLTIKFASHEGHFGTMQMSGGMARGLEEAREFWVGERQSVPGFLAQVTTEMFEKTTMGRAAGYVGLE